jgi:hypothetical protein
VRCTTTTTTTVNSTSYAINPTTSTKQSIINAAMPSIKKLFTPSSHTVNPYANPAHPTNIASNSSPATRLSRPQPPPPRPASPRGSFDYLAEARAAVGRDPVTARRLADQNQPPGGITSGIGIAESSRSSGFVREGTITVGGGGGGGVDEISAFNNRNNGVKKTYGTKYDLFVQQMKDKQKGVWREPRDGFYAPERRLGEFYGPQGGL